MTKQPWSFASYLFPSLDCSHNWTLPWRLYKVECKDPCTYFLLVPLNTYFIFRDYMCNYLSTFTTPTFCCRSLISFYLFCHSVYTARITPFSLFNTLIVFSQGNYFWFRYCSILWRNVPVHISFCKDYPLSSVIISFKRNLLFPRI